jgi:hypothetical protein
MGITNPEELSTEEYYRAYAEWEYLRKMDRDFYISILRQIISEIFPEE